jgi:anti-anti-sigma factor
MLTVRSDRAGDVSIIKCAGRIVRGQENILRDAVLQQKSARIIVVDLSEVESIDAGGLTLLVDLHRWTENNRSHLKLVNPRPFVHEMLTRTHLSCVFDISSFNDALAALGCELGHEREHERRTVAVAAI